MTWGHGSCVLAMAGLWTARAVAASTPATMGGGEAPLESAALGRAA
ncbi:MAG: hypothetical protein U0166_06515 [Acidobacteriota bacterium]